MGLPPSGSGAPGSSVGPDPSNMSARTCVSRGAAAFPLGQDRGCLAKCHWRPQQDSPAFQRGAPAQEPLEAAGVLPGAEGPGDLRPPASFLWPGTTRTQWAPQRTQLKGCPDSVCWAFQRAEPAPGLERSKTGPLVAWKEAPGGAAVEPAGPGPSQASPTGCPFPAPLGPAAKLGALSCPPLEAARWPALGPRLGGKWPRRRLPPAPPGGSGLQTPPPGVRRAPRPAWGQSSRRAGRRDPGDRGPAGGGQAGSPAAPPPAPSPRPLSSSRNGERTRPCFPFFSETRVLGTYTLLGLLFLPTLSLPVSMATPPNSRFQAAMTSPFPFLPPRPPIAAATRGHPAEPPWAPPPPRARCPLARPFPGPLRPGLPATPLPCGSCLGPGGPCVAPVVTVLGPCRQQERWRPCGLVS